MSEIFGDFPPSYEAYQQLDVANIHRINNHFYNAGVTAAKAATKLGLESLANVQKMYLGDNVFAAAQNLFDEYYPWHDDEDSKDHIWQTAVYTGIIAGHHVGRMMNGTLVNKDRLDEGIANRLDEIAVRAQQSYSLADTLQKEVEGNPMSKAALMLLPDQYANGYDTAQNSLSRDKQSLYKHALGVTATVSLGLAVETVFALSQPGEVVSKEEGEVYVARFTEQLAALPEYIETTDRPPYDA